jgi:branched-subunit amino acid aminotransferase/4-amino-4-deoxychorismate lyase
MHEYVSFNRKIQSAAGASISAASSAALYGKGIFTTVAVFNAKPFLWDKHLLRLRGNAEKIKIDLSEYDKETISAALAEIIGVNNLEDARVRLTFFDEAPGGIWSFTAQTKTSLLITTAERREVSPTFRLTVSPFQVNSASPLAGVKSCNYMEKIIALEEAKKRGFDEAVQMNERGEIVSACMANIFWTINGELFTPSLKTGCLPGTTREFLLEKIKCREIEANSETLKKADAVFLTSAGIGIVQISEYENRKYETKFEQITRLIQSI